VSLLVNVAASRIKPPTLKRKRDRGYAPAYQIFGEGSHATPTTPEPTTPGQEQSEANSDEGARKPGEKPGKPGDEARGQERVKKLISGI